MVPIRPTIFNDTKLHMAREFEEGTTAPHAITAFRTPSAKPAWDTVAFLGRRLYIRTLQDALFPIPVQDMFIQSSGVEWQTVDIDAAHGAYLSRPKELANIICDYARTWQSLF